MADIKAALQNTATPLTATDVTSTVGLSPVRNLCHKKFATFGNLMSN